MGVHVGAGCHCWAAIAGDRGGVAVCVGGLDVVPLLAAIAGCHCWAAIAGLPLLGAIAGLPLLGIGGVGAHVGGLDVPLLGCHCWG